MEFGEIHFPSSYKDCTVPSEQEHFPLFLMNETIHLEIHFHTHTNIFYRRVYHPGHDAVRTKCGDTQASQAFKALQALLAKTCIVRYQTENSKGRHTTEGKLPTLE